MGSDEREGGQRPIRRDELRGTWAIEREAQLSDVKVAERAAIQKAYGLEAAASSRDHSLTLFNRTRWDLGNGGTFAAVDFLEDMR